jgi:branched-subunit amino acid ABC-type transport system permease component
MIASGAYWANQTWGSYWSWDPKETWAAITWLVYAVICTCASPVDGVAACRVLRHPRLCVVMFTFFGVTYLLPGLARLCLAILSPRQRQLGPEAETVQTTAAPRQAPGWPDGGERIKSAGSPQEENFRLSSVRVNWQLKAILPVGFVLLAGLLLFILATVSFRDPERHAVLIVAGAGAVAICGVSIGALAFLHSTAHGRIAGEDWRW